jgi:GTP diphosphokinase / guanosine-3',5'-bis(diphosphate) 3'-diphosphatase
MLGTPRVLISDLCELAETYLEPAHVKSIFAAYLFGAEAHEGQYRRSGEAFIFHPVAVAHILAQMRMDAPTLCAAILHDVIEDTPCLQEEITRLFGEDVTRLVDGVSKLTRMPSQTREEAQAESFRKMILAMSKDIRVIIIKLADRLHNMRTIAHMKPESQKRIARETLDIYALIAGRLGMNAIRTELEDLSFAVLYPVRYRVIEQAVTRHSQIRRDILQHIETAISQRLAQHQLTDAQVIRTDRHYYGIYRKMREKKRDIDSGKHIDTFKGVIEACRFAIVVKDSAQCYSALGVLHNLYKPVTEQFKDYIAIPRMSGYQALHTTLFGPQGLKIAAQIRSQAMQEIADMGIASQGLYRFNEVSHETRQVTQQRAIDWLRSLLEIQQSAGNCQEFLENVKMDLFPNEVYVFTPKGQILQLPRGATALDFAYAVHSEVGLHCHLVKIDNNYANPHTVLESGQTIEIFVNKNSYPIPKHLSQVVTVRAHSQIRSFLRHQQTTDAKKLGRRLLENELAPYRIRLNQLTEEQLQQLLMVANCQQLDQLLIQIGSGHPVTAVLTHQIAAMFKIPSLTESLSRDNDPTEEQGSSTSESKTLLIKGTEGVMLQYARCCRPIPGDDIVGFVSAGRGLVIHRSHCKNVRDHRQQGNDKYLNIAWDHQVQGEYIVDVRLDVTNEVGVLATIATTLTAMNVNIETIANENEGVYTSMLCLSISVRDRQHLASIIRDLRRLRVVTKIQRMRS